MVGSVVVVNILTVRLRLTVLSSVEVDGVVTALTVRLTSSSPTTARGLTPLSLLTVRLTLSSHQRQQERADAIVTVVVSWLLTMIDVM